MSRKYRPNIPLQKMRKKTCWHNLLVNFSGDRIFVRTNNTFVLTEQPQKQILEEDSQTQRRK